MGPETLYMSLDERRMVSLDGSRSLMEVFNGSQRVYLILPPLEDLRLKLPRHGPLLLTPGSLGSKDPPPSSLAILPLLLSPLWCPVYRGHQGPQEGTPLQHAGVTLQTVG